LAWKEHEQTEAKKRMTSGRPKEGVETLPQDTGKARDKIGERVGVSGKSIDKVATVAECFRAGVLHPTEFF
jgi:hypothetical protein